MNTIPRMWEWSLSHDMIRLAPGFRSTVNTCRGCSLSENMPMGDRNIEVDATKRFESHPTVEGGALPTFLCSRYLRGVPNMPRGLPLTAGRNDRTHAWQK